jgi:endo-1,4-beta-D-glucanase Y
LNLRYFTVGVLFPVFLTCIEQDDCLCDSLFKLKEPQTPCVCDTCPEQPPCSCQSDSVADQNDTGKENVMDKNVMDKDTGITADTSVNNENNDGAAADTGVATDVDTGSVFATDTASDDTDTASENGESINTDTTTENSEDNDTATEEDNEEAAVVECPGICFPYSESWARCNELGGELLHEIPCPDGHCCVVDGMDNTDETGNSNDNGDINVNTTEEGNADNTSVDNTSVDTTSDNGNVENDSNNDSNNNDDVDADVIPSGSNLFSEVLGKSQAEIDEKLEAVFQHFFYGDDNQKLYYESGNGACIHDINSGDVRSEGQSYGMMIAVQMDKKAEFDKIWSWTKSVMGQGNGKFGWQASYGGQLNSSGSAPDGEEYIAAALIFAGTRWGDNSYIQEAKQICGAMKSSFFDQGSKIIKFIENVNYSDPSYVLPSFYEVFAEVDNANAGFWTSAAQNGRNYYHKVCNPTTMLGPYIANFDGSVGPSDAGGDRGDVYRNDCWRICMNIMMDWHLFGVDSWQRDSFAPKHFAFMKEIYSSPPYPTDMELNGTIITAYDKYIIGNLGTLAMLGFGLPKKDAAFFLQLVWDVAPPAGQYRYYDGLLYTMALLHCSGQFRLYY